MRSARRVRATSGTSCAAPVPRRVRLVLVLRSRVEVIRVTPVPIVNATLAAGCRCGRGIVRCVGVVAASRAAARPGQPTGTNRRERAKPNLHTATPPRKQPDARGPPR
jgi:hypothetical protein